ncbi:MAG: glycoside hydrolase family 57 protein [Candidatus Bathyarchaeota archaeon]|nr:MAG: glycoside hydrolase family 57 protein [Candidatus Bathyarchaeota archaeon]
MTDICLMFEAHQPLRLNHNFPLDLLGRPSVKKKDLAELYFNQKLNRHVFERVARKCYFPSNNIILEQIDRYKRGRKKFKVAYGISGVLIEQCERWNPDLLDSFKQLAESKCVEFLDQPYYHSLASLYGMDRSEFVEQIKMHRQLMKDLFNYKPKVVENTECLYNNAIAKTVEGLGYEATVTEGAERILGGRSPNHVYRAKDSSLRVLLRNYRLSDDIGFRFSSTRWEEWPLTAEKYASWLASNSGQVIVLFVDYETFGEHHWPESGIHDFLRWLPGEVVKWDNLDWHTPSEVVQRHAPVGEIDVQEFNTVSWADLERDPSAWIANPMQMLCFKSLKRLEQPVKAIGDENLIRLWRYLQTSDHLYYINIKGGGPGEVHSYFNPSGSPLEAFTVYSKVLADLEARVMSELGKPKLSAKRILRRLPVGAGFAFFYKLGQPTEWTVYSLDELYSALKVVSLKSIRLHSKKGDFGRWLRHVVGDDKLADELESISKKKLTGKKLREMILNAVKARIDELKGISIKR